MKNFSKIEIAVIKRTAQNVSQFVTKKEKMNAEIEKIKASKQEMIDKYAATLDEKIAAKVAKVQAEPDLMDKFQKQPVQTVEGIIGVDLPDDIINGVVDGVKAKLGVDSVSGIIDKIGGLFGGKKD